MAPPTTSIKEIRILVITAITIAIATLVLAASPASLLLLQLLTAYICSLTARHFTLITTWLEQLCVGGIFLAIIQLITPLFMVFLSPSYMGATTGLCAIATLAIFLRIIFPRPTTLSSRTTPPSPTLIIVLALAAILRFTNLGYSDFQGDELRALFFTDKIFNFGIAEVLTHKKAPAELLIPAPFVYLGERSEYFLRTSFALYGVLVVAATALITLYTVGPVASVIAGIICSLDGYLIAFSRIIQYQEVVLLGMIMSIFFARINQSWLLCGMSLSIAALAHYDFIIALIPLSFIWIEQWRSTSTNLRTKFLRSSLFNFSIGFLPALLFYWKFFTNPAFIATRQYLVEQRLGSQFFYNNLPEFLLRTSIYSSFWFTLAMIFGATIALCRYFTNSSSRTLLSPYIFWFLASFCGAAFFVARPVTHFYPESPALALLVAYAINTLRIEYSFITKRILITLCTIVGILSLVHQWRMFVSTNDHSWYDYPDNQSWLYPIPYAEPFPTLGFFGFPDRKCYRAIARLVESNEINIQEGISFINDSGPRWYLPQVHRFPHTTPRYAFVPTKNSRARDIFLKNNSGTLGSVRYQCLAGGKIRAELYDTRHEAGTITQITDY